jgi:hypothetical protein
VLALFPELLILMVLIKRVFCSVLVVEVVSVETFDVPPVEVAELVLLSGETALLKQALKLRKNNKVRVPKRKRAGFFEKANMFSE